MGDAGVETRLYDRGCARGLGLGTMVRKEVDERRHDDGQRHSGETLVENAGSRALSTAEAEDYAVVTGAAECLGMQPMMSARVRVWTNSNAAKAIASRRGLGDTRHTELKFSWLQEMTKSGRVKIKWVPGEQHLADHLKKVKSWCEIDELIRGVGGQMTVTIINKGNEPRWKKWQVK